MKRITAKRAGTCHECGGSFRAGETIAWDGRTWHPTCFDARHGTPEQQQAQDEYNRGVADVLRYQRDKAELGEEMAEALEMERELRTMGEPD